MAMSTRIAIVFSVVIGLPFTMGLLPASAIAAPQHRPFFRYVVSGDETTPAKSPGYIRDYVAVRDLILLDLWEDMQRTHQTWILAEGSGPSKRLLRLPNGPRHFYTVAVKHILFGKQGPVPATFRGLQHGDIGNFQPMRLGSDNLNPVGLIVTRIPRHAVYHSVYRLGIVYHVAAAFRREVVPAAKYLAKHKKAFISRSQLHRRLNQPTLLKLLSNKNAVLAVFACQRLQNTGYVLGANFLNGPFIKAKFLVQAAFAYEVIHQRHSRRALVALKRIISEAQAASEIKSFSLGALLAAVWYRKAAAREILGDILQREKHFHANTAADKYVREILRQAKIVNALPKALSVKKTRK